MGKKYNLALIPLAKGDKVVTLAKQFATLADKYLLGEKSLPHVTLYQFQAEEKALDQIWKTVCQVWEGEPIDLTFNQFSCLSFDNDIFWVSLLPNHGDALHKMHVDIAHSLQLPAKVAFNPHMTLLNSKNKQCEQAVALLADSYEPIMDTFVLSLGSSDEVGQLTEIIYRTV